MVLWHALCKGFSSTFKSHGVSPLWPAVLQLERHVNVQILEDGTGAGGNPTEAALCGPLQVILPVDLQVSLHQVVHDDEAHLEHIAMSEPAHCYKIGSASLQPSIGFSRSVNATPTLSLKLAGSLGQPTDSVANA